MNQVSETEIESYLESLRQACTSPIPSREDIKVALLRVLMWLNEANHNTDENCRKVDLYVTLEVNHVDRKQLSQDIEDILFDIGGALHDTHSHPNIAVNFQSTPQQLLERATKL